MEKLDHDTLVQTIRSAAHPLHGGAHDYDALMDLVGDAKCVLLGEASHGTHEFYDARAHITRRLIQEKGFNAVAVEADWPDAYRVNRYVRGASADARPEDALQDFQRFPRWMWRNTDVLDFVAWLRRYNDGCAADAPKAGFYGLDLYSMFTSMDAVLRYLEKADPQAAARARYRYACFDHFKEDPQAYGYAASFDLSTSCEKEVLSQMRELQQQPPARQPDDAIDRDELFFVQQNARLVKNAENYYRSMFQGRVESWNNRDRHMMQTLEALVAHLDDTSQNARVVVWAHNSHLGDARATEMGDAGELNLGQLARERWGRDAVLVGFTTNTGTVTAASEWDGLPERKPVRPGMAGSFESLFHDVGLGRFLLLPRDNEAVRDALATPRLERAIGVIYLPNTERISHYFHARLGKQFDAVIHIDDTTAVEPLDRQAGHAERDMAETFPTGL